MRIVECPKCGTDISDTFQAAEPDVGVTNGSWFCDACDVVVEQESDDDDSDLLLGEIR